MLGLELFAVVGVVLIQDVTRFTLKINLSLRLFSFLLLTYLSCDVFAQERSVVFLPELDRPSTAHRPQRKIGKPRFAPPPTTQSHNSGQTEFENINVTNDNLFDQNEPSIAINPTDPTNIVSGANDYRTEPALWGYTSKDQGRTWLNQELPRNTTLALATDPALTFDRNGKVFYSNGRFDVSGIPFPRNEVVVYRSDDKGTTWNLPTRPFLDTSTLNSASVLSDKYFVAVDHNVASPFKDRIYVVWTEYATSGSRIVSSRSTDGGNTWSARVYLTAAGNFTAPIPVTAPNGDVYVTWIDKSNKKEILAARSGDGGASFAPAVKVSNYKDLGPVVPPGNPNERPYIKEFIGINSFPSIAVDHSTKFNGRIYVSWAGRDDSDNPHIYVSHSSNNGQNWSVPKAVEANPSPIVTDRFFNWIAVDPANGDVGVIYYDSRLDSINNRLADVFFSHSNDGGESYRSARVTSQSIDPHIAQAFRQVEEYTFVFFGDYIALGALSSKWHGAWADTRSGNNQEIYTSLIRPYAPHSVENLHVSEDAEESAVLMWDYDPITTMGYPLGSHLFEIRRDDGVVIQQGSSVREYTDATVEGGKSYTYTVYAVAGNDTSIGRNVRFIPIGSRKPQPVEILTSTASPDGFGVTIRIPDRNELNQPLEGLDSLYVLIDGELRESLGLTDVFKGTEQTRSYNAIADTFHKYQVLVSTAKEGFRTHGDTATAFLYAGESRTSYQNDFEQGTSVYTPFAWATTPVTSFGSQVLNDSLPDVNYRPSVSSWFLLPPVRVSNETRMLEYDHIALINELDIALVEVSFSNGVNFQSIAQYNVATRPGSWNTALSNSTPVHERVNLAGYMDSNAIARFRIVSSTGGMDGWFIDNITFSNVARVARSEHSRELSMYPNPIRVSQQGSIMLTADLNAKVRVNVYDMLGRLVLKRPLRMTSTSATIPYQLDEPGSYIVDITIETSSGVEHLRDRVIVIP